MTDEQVKLLKQLESLVRECQELSFVSVKRDEKIKEMLEILSKIRGVK